MNKQEALKQLIEINNQFGNINVSRLQQPGYVTTMDMTNLKNYLNPIIKALEPDPNYFVIPEFKEKCMSLINSYDSVTGIILSILSDLVMSIHLWNSDRVNNDVLERLAKSEIKTNLAKAYISLMTLKLFFDFSENEIGKMIDKELTIQINKLISA